MSSTASQGRASSCPENSAGNHVEGNFIGTNPTGTLDRGNRGAGVDIEGAVLSRAVVGGTTPAARNLISGNAGNGVFMGGFNGNARADSLRVQDNYIGTDRSGTKDLGNDLAGLDVQEASDTKIGGTTVASRNVISGNGNEGVALDYVSGTKVLGNRIGTTASGTGALGNDFDGVFIEDIADTASNNVLGDGTSAGSNTIAFNRKYGVNLFSGTGDEIFHNSIFSNAGLGIDLIGPGESFTSNVPTPNDEGDGDSGANNLQNKPILSSAKTVSGKTTIKGRLDSTPSTPTTQTFTIEFFSNPKGNEGKKFIGQKSVRTDGSGNRSFTFSPAKAVAVGKTITATATRSSTLDTSEFSAPRKVASS